MQLDDYQRLAKKNRQPHNPGTDPLSIFALGLCSEAGEVADLVHKRLWKPEDERFYRNMEEELGDTLWYLASLASEIGMSLSFIAAGNLMKLEARYANSST